MKSDKTGIQIMYLLQFPGESDKERIVNREHRGWFNENGFLIAEKKILDSNLTNVILGFFFSVGNLLDTFASQDLD